MFGIIGNFGPWELVMILAIILIIFGPGKLPQVGKSMGAAMKNFKKAQDDTRVEVWDEDKSNQLVNSSIPNRHNV